MKLAKTKKTSALAEQAAEIADAISEFSKQSEADEHTDTEMAWVLLNDAHSVLRAIAQEAV